MIKILLSILIFILNSFVVQADEEKPFTAEYVMTEAIKHARGPQGMMVVGRGNMNVDGIIYNLTTGRVFMDDCEGVLTAFQAKYSSVDAGSAGETRWQTVRCRNISMASYMPSLGRARKVYAPMLAMLGSELTPYLTLTATSWERDYNQFSFKSNNAEKPVIVGLRSKKSLSPFASCTWHLKKWHDAYVPVQIVCEWEEGKIKQVFSDYTEVAGAPKYYAPKGMTIGEYTKLVFEDWSAVPEERTVISRNHALLGDRKVIF
ncbi:MAG: hypothetical protein COU90_03585 [Candidatus Ryanbacteria bacterium CG10_big_fil_rev_8_21_14_0_10_43_42]|uniref:Uncharacterized protein n=1 Tax=Candidatus Ryanbacteria bacterium CG10_big_fil_rev_8_21_14_0_10_43_42 TaxID=1974864 RepID=A0A2M8KWJ2_9BACT|nr:MAG: hypothetical protein COU90_03585 [Candidatus Ryanbacteria bacterium CG10_big_fil_rev_8_21_14_0_10_43_42]